jgi:hypothetical protein
MRSMRPLLSLPAGGMFVRRLANTKPWQLYLPVGGPVRLTPMAASRAACGLRVRAITPGVGSRSMWFGISWPGPRYVVSGIARCGRGFSIRADYNTLDRGRKSPGPPGPRAEIRSPRNKVTYPHRYIGSAPADDFMSRYVIGPEDSGRRLLHVGVTYSDSSATGTLWEKTNGQVV